MGDRLGRVAQRVDQRLGTDVYSAQRLARRINGRVASGPRRLKVFLACLLFGTRRWNRPVTLRLDGPNGPVPFTIPDYAGFKVLDDVFVWREYDIDLDAPPTSVLDLGSHIGVSALFFRLRWPDAHITAVEASPRLFRLLQANVRAFGVEAHHGAVAAHDGTVGFADSSQSWAGAIGQGVQVPAIALDTLLAQPVDLMKLDIEGAEFEALPASAHLHNAKVIVGEIHALPDARPTREVLAMLGKFAVTIEGGVHHTLFTAVRK